MINLKTGLLSVLLISAAVPANAQWHYEQYRQHRYYRQSYPYYPPTTVIIEEAPPPVIIRRQAPVIIETPPVIEYVPAPQRYIDQTVNPTPQPYTNCIVVGRTSARNPINGQSGFYPNCKLSNGQTVITGDFQYYR